MAVYQLGFPTCEWDSRDCIVSSLRHSECSLSEWKPSRAKASHHLSAPSLRRGPLRAMGEDPKLSPAPSPRTLTSPQLAQGAGSGQEAMGRPFPQTTGGGGGGTSCRHCHPTPKAGTNPSPNPCQKLNLSYTHSSPPRLLPSPPAQHKGLLPQRGFHWIPSWIRPGHTGHPSNLRPGISHLQPQLNLTSVPTRGFGDPGRVWSVQGSW